MKATDFTHTWKKGQKVVKIFYGIRGYREASISTVTKVSKDTIFIDGETGITFDANGKEKELFFPEMRQEITPLNEQNQSEAMGEESWTNN